MKDKIQFLNTILEMSNDKISCFLDLKKTRQVTTMHLRLPHKHLKGQLLSASQLHTHESADGALHECVEDQLVAGGDEGGLWRSACRRS